LHYDIHFMSFIIPENVITIIDLDVCVWESTCTIFFVRSSLSFWPLEWEQSDNISASPRKELEIA